MGNKSANDRLIATIASQQFGLITTDQLATAGLGRSGVSRRVDTGRVHRVHRGVYAVGSPHLSRHARWLAAVLTCGDGAVLSHRSAAELWALRQPGAGPVHVTVPTSGGRRGRAGIAVHRSYMLSASAVTRRMGIPVTTPTRTINDLRGMVAPDQMNALIREAQVRGFSIDAALTRDLEPTRSVLERRFLALCRRHRIPSPSVNVRIAGLEVDFYWPESGLIVETDGYRYHGTRAGFEGDRARDAKLKSLGYEVLRFSFRQVVNEPRMVATTIREVRELRLELPAGRRA